MRAVKLSPYHGLEGSEDLPQLPSRPHFPICSASHSSILTQTSSPLAFTTVQSTLLSRCVPWLIHFLNLGFCCLHKVFYDYTVKKSTSLLHSLLLPVLFFFLALINNPHICMINFFKFVDLPH